MRGAGREADLDGVLDAVEDIRGATSLEDLTRRTSTHLLRLVPSDSVSFNWVAPGALHAVVEPPVPPRLSKILEPMLAARWRENPLAEHFRRTADVRPLTWDDVADRRLWRASALYHDLYQVLGVTDQLGVRLPSPPGVVGGLVLNRARSFDARDKMVLGLVGAHVALQMHTLAERAVERLGPAHRGWGLVQVDERDHVVGSSRAWDERYGIHVGDQLPGPLVREMVPMRSRGREQVMTPHEPREVSWETARATAVPIPGWCAPHTLLLRPDDESLPIPGRHEGLRSRGLSPREAEVALLIVQGAANQRFATLLGISLGTVKKHCQRIYRELEVDNRAAAAAVVARIVA